MKIQRRQCLKTGLLAGVSMSTPSVWAQNALRSNAGGLMVGQIADVSNAYQDISKDFIIGSRTAWQEINAAGGIRGQRIRHQVIEMDGSSVELDKAWKQLRDDESCLATFGSCADAMASQVTVRNSAERNELAHAAPWLQNAAIDSSRGTFPIFSNREQQLKHALQSMSCKA